VTATHAERGCCEVARGLTAQERKLFEQLRELQRYDALNVGELHVPENWVAR
jgi:hypothetical protein